MTNITALFYKPAQINATFRWYHQSGFHTQIVDKPQMMYKNTFSVAFSNDFDTDGFFFSTNSQIQLLKVGR